MDSKITEFFEGLGLDVEMTEDTLKIRSEETGEVLVITALADSLEVPYIDVRLFP